MVESGLEFSLADAHVFQQSYWPNAYDYDLADTAHSLMSLERAISFAKRRKTRVEIFIECTASWTCLLIKLFTTAVYL
jgi:hypothetical protein